MTRRLLTSSLVLLLAPATAGAKELTEVSVCGASGCETLTQKDMPNERLHLLAESTGESAPPDAAAPWYRIRVTGRGDGETFSWTQAYVPSAGLVRGLEDAAPVWAVVLPEAQEILARVTRGLEPMPASTLAGLDVEPPQAQVAEVFSPARDGGGAPWWWIGAGLAALAGAGALLRLSPPYRHARTAPGWRRRDTAASHRSGT